MRRALRNPIKHSLLKYRSLIVDILYINVMQFRCNLPIKYNERINIKYISMCVCVCVYNSTQLSCSFYFSQYFISKELYCSIAKKLKLFSYVYSKFSKLSQEKWSTDGSDAPTIIAHRLRYTYKKTCSKANVKLTMRTSPSRRRRRRRNSAASGGSNINQIPIRGLVGATEIP